MADKKARKKELRKICSIEEYRRIYFPKTYSSQVLSEKQEKPEVFGTGLVTDIFKAIRPKESKA